MTNNEWGVEFDSKFGVLPEEEGGWMYPPSPSAIKDFIRNQLALARREAQEGTLLVVERQGKLFPEASTENIVAKIRALSIEFLSPAPDSTDKDTY